MTAMFWWLAGAVTLVFILILRRIWPYMNGRARSRDDRSQTLNRWNTYMVPMLRTYMTEGLSVGLAGSFKSVDDKTEYTSATWSLQPTLFPEVDYIALALPVDEESSQFEIVGFIEAESLREKLGQTIEPQMIFGHQTWVYVWPDGIDYEAIIESCIAADEFKKTHGLVQPQSMETS
ncbi:MAG: hypothetical protein CMH52_12160 [Myxococcales bacterium]|nr:hypothetical protein [Myxococcales bacterium]